MVWLLTCEHYSNGIPLKYSHVFKNAIDVLESHRGYDVRVAPMYIRLEPLFDQAFYFRYSRLLIEPNRSLGNTFLFSPFTATLSAKEKSEIISKYYQPYRNKVEQFASSYIDQQILHLALHSFTPTLGNRNRESEIGIGFSTGSRAEREMAVLLKKQILEAAPESKIRFNYPYRTHEDDFQDYLRHCFDEGYIGINLEVRNDVILDYRKVIYESIANLRGIIG